MLFIYSRLLHIVGVKGLRFKPLLCLLAVAGSAGAAFGKELNLAPLAVPSANSYLSQETLSALNDGFEPENSADHSHGVYATWPLRGMNHVEYEWSQPISTSKVDVYWWDASQAPTPDAAPPKACRLLYWDGKAFTPVQDGAGLGVAANRYNTTTFAEVTTTRMRLEFEANEMNSVGIIEWRVYDSGKSPRLAPRVTAGPVRVVVLPEPAILAGTVSDRAARVTWKALSGPGKVTFGTPKAPVTTVRFSRAGEYVLELSARSQSLSGSATVRIAAELPPEQAHLSIVEPRPFKLTSPFWRDRLRTHIVSWIPHVAAVLDDPKTPQYGMNLFDEAAKKLAGKPARPYYRDQPAWHVDEIAQEAAIYNTIEAMSLALLVDADGDAGILAAQEAMRKTLEGWIPRILAAQEPDGYLHTGITRGNWPRWTQRHNHEGYLGGYFIEAALAHHLMTGGKDRRLYDAARRLADCWEQNLGPQKRPWWDSHEGMEQALQRLAEFADEHEGAGQGHRYLALSRFLLDSRRGGEEFDQAYRPAVAQAEAVGHAVCASYLYSGMAGIAMESGDRAYLGAVRSIWNSIVHHKLYLTGAIGTGESYEGFGKDYSLPHTGYGESCASCGLIFFQHRLQRTYADARYAHVLEQTLYNGLLGSVDLEGKNFTYQNSLDSSAARYSWHGCPCCVGNIPRTLLRLPTWIYSRGDDSVYVNLYVGSRMQLGDLELIQVTDYPWHGKVTLIVNPATSRRLAIKLRVPDPDVSQLYRSTPLAKGLLSITVNGEAITPKVESGYAVITRQWVAGDRIELELPLEVQRVHAHPSVEAAADRVALRRGPIVYNLESVDQDVEGVLPASAPLTAEWQPTLLGGVMAINGTFASGKPLLAVPNYARLNRGGRSLVWVREK